MQRNRRRKLVGTAYVMPALLFVLVFTVYPFIRMFWISLNDWTLITPPEYVGLDNFSRAFEDDQFWSSLRFTLKYTILITPILIVGGYLIALLTVANTRLRRFTRGVVFIPVVIGLAASSLLWYWLFSARYGLVNRMLVDLGIIDEPVLWLGVDPTCVDVGRHRVGRVEGARLRDDPVRRRHPGRAAGDQRGGTGRRRYRVATDDTGDGAAHDADDPARDARQRDRLAARLRPVLPDDGRPADEPDGDVGVLRVPQLVPVPEAGLRRSLVADPRRVHPPVHRRPDDPDPAQSVNERGDAGRLDRARRAGRSHDRLPSPSVAGATSALPCASPCAP